MSYYFDFGTYFKIVALVLRDRPSPRRWVIHFMMLGVLSMWALSNAVCLELDRVFFPGYRKTRITRPVFIVGNARSGTTLFHRLLSEDEEHFVYFRGWEILFPSLVQKKLIRAVARAFPGLAERFRRWEERQWSDVRRIRPGGLTKPEEDEFLFLTSFASSVLCVLFPYSEALVSLTAFDERPARVRKKVMRFYRECVKRQLYLYGGERTILSKNPAFISKLRSLNEEFPDAKFIYLIRNPFETIPSLLKLMSTIWQQIGITSAHIDRSLRQITMGSMQDYKRAAEVLQNLPQDRYAIVEYQDLVTDPKAAVEAVYRKLGLTISPEFEKKLAAERKRQKRFQSFNVYSLEEFGLSEDLLSEGMADIMSYHGYRSAGPATSEATEML